MKKTYLIPLILSLGISTLNAKTYTDRELFGMMKPTMIQYQLFTHLLKTDCLKPDLQSFAKLHSQAEWIELMKTGNFKKEMQTICPKAPSNYFKDEYLEDFFPVIINQNLGTIYFNKVY